MKKAITTIMITLIAVCISGCGSKLVTLKLNDYLSIDYSGYNGYGTALVRLNMGDLEDAAMAGLGINVDDGFGSLKTLLTLEEGIKVSVEPTTGLSNGDKVKVSFQYDDEALKAAGFKIKSESEAVTIEGLEEISEIDPFENIEVELSGIAPDVTARVIKDSSNEALSYIDFTLDKDRELCKGDLITITANDMNSILESKGYHMSRTQMEYKVGEVDKYVTAISDIPEAALTYMQTEATDYLEAKYAEIYEYVSHTDFVYEGAYLLNAKESLTWGDHNTLYLIYSTEATSLKDGFVPTRVYLPIKCSNLVNYADGTYSVEVSKHLIGNTDLPTGYWGGVLAGYTNTSTMFMELVTTQKSDYTYEIDGDLGQ